MKKLVSVFVCGVQKGGTTSLYSYFAAHPDLLSPREKELHYFSNEKFNWKTPKHDRYHSWFPTEETNRLPFDITPIYCFWPPAMRRIAEYNPQAKLIFLFRDPFDRAFSHWCMEYTRRTDNMLFSDAISGGRNRLVGLPAASPLWRVFTYIERGFYAQQVRRAMDCFPSQNILFLRSEDLLTKHVETLDEIARFLGIAPFGKVRLIKDHQRQNTIFPSEKTEADRRYARRRNGRVRGADKSRYLALAGCSKVAAPA